MSAFSASAFDSSAFSVDAFDFEVVTPVGAVYAYRQGNLFVLPNFIPPPPIVPIPVNPKNIIRVARQENKISVKRNSNKITVKRNSNKIIVRCD